MAKAKKAGTTELTQAFETLLAPVPELSDQDKAKIEKIDAEIEVERQKIAAANAAFQRKFKRLQKHRDALKETVPLSFETAMIAYDTFGENSRGYQWLKERIGYEHMRYGWFFNGCYWPETNQWQIHVVGKHDATDEDLEEGARRFEAALPFIKAGAWSKANITMGMKKVDASGWKVFHIFCADGEKLVFTGEKWMVCGTYNYGTVPEFDTILEAFKHLRHRLTYGRPDEDRY